MKWEEKLSENEGPCGGAGGGIRLQKNKKNWKELLEVSS